MCCGKERSQAINLRTFWDKRERREFRDRRKMLDAEKKKTCDYKIKQKNNSAGRLLKWAKDGWQNTVRERRSGDTRSSLCYI